MAPHQTALRSFLYGGAATLLAADLFLLVKALFTDNFVPIVPIVAGIFTAAGLLFIVYAEHQAREQDKRAHRRISRVSHQLTSPLHTLEDDLTHLMTEAEKLPAEVRLKLKRMETKTKVLLENIRDVFLMLQAQEDGLPQEPRLYNLCTIINDVVTEQQPLASARNVEVLHTLHCADAPVRVDKQLLTIAITHLLENAITYTLTPSIVNLAVMRGKKRVRLVIQDRGIGISPDDAHAVFEPFARGERAAKYDPDGIGVGLTLAKHIVEQSGGRLRWRNRDQAMGAQFEIILPLAQRK